MVDKTVVGACLGQFNVNARSGKNFVTSNDCSERPEHLITKGCAHRRDDELFECRESRTTGWILQSVGRETQCHGPCSHCERPHNETGSVQRSKSNARSGGGRKRGCDSKTRIREQDG